MRHVLLGSAPAPPAVLRRAIAAAPGVEVLSVYAMTEALPVAVASAPEKLPHPGGDLLGASLPGVTVRTGEDGELFVGGPHLAHGYLGQAPLGEVATGDLGRIEPDGRIVLLGRRKDMVLRDGFDINPGLYEPDVAALPGVAEAAIGGPADPDTGDEEVVLAVVPGPGFDERRLRAALPDVVDVGARHPATVSISDPVGVPRLSVGVGPAAGKISGASRSVGIGSGLQATVAGEHDEAVRLPAVARRRPAPGATRG